MAVIDLGFRPRPWQSECFKKLKRFSVMVCHRRAGKSVLAIMWLIHKALTQTGNDGRFAYVAPEKGQAKAVAWDYVKRYATKIPGTKVSEVELSVEFSNGSRIQLYGADDPDRLRGIYLDGVVLDELADMKPTTWDEVVRPALTDRKGSALFIGTPKGLNLLSQLYFDAAGKPDWFSARYTVDDTGAIDPTELAAAKRDMSISKFRQEFLCDFTAGNDDAFISAEMVDEAVAREPQRMPSDVLVMGVDVARFGGDETVMTFRCGRDAVTIKAIHLRGIDTMQVAARVCEEFTRWGCDQVFIDESGVGGGVLDRCIQLGVHAIGVNNGARSDSPVEGLLVANKGAEIWARMREWIKSGGALPNDPELRMQLGSRRYGYNAHSEIVLEKKTDLKKRGLPSCDRADSLSLTFSFPVAPKPMEFDASIRAYVRKGQGTVIKEYDPFARLR